MSRDASQKRTGSRSGFDEASVGEAEDVDGEDDPHSGPSSVLWERHIEQSIFVDISDDESLHFSDLQDAFTVHLKQGSGAPESPHFNDNAELSCETEESSKESAESTSSENVEHINTRNKSTKAPMQRLRTAVKPVIGSHTDDAINTSDEEHEDLPYDGAHTNHKTCHNVHETSSQLSSVCEMGAMMPIQDFNVGDVEETYQSNLASNPKATKDVTPPLAKPIQAATHITDFLLRHFSQDELLNSSRMIDAETLPEISLMDSIDETVLSRVSHAPQISSGEREKILNKMEEPADSHGLFEVTISERGTQEAECNSRNIPNESSSYNQHGKTCNDDTASSRGSDVASTGDDECPKESCSVGSQDLSNVDAQLPKLSFSRTRSFSEMKYGQGQVHYPLPDFSKVAPKVKIPKGNGTVKPISQSPAMTRAQSSPGILGKNTSSCKATVDVISRVLEDSIMAPERHNEFSAHQLQAEYDRLLAKYTDAENLIGEQIHASSEPSVSINWNETTTNNDNTKLTARTPQATAAVGSGVEQCSLVQNSPPVETEPQRLTDGERLTSDLRDIISSFMQKVDEFKTCVSTMSMNVEEQQMVLKSMMEAQDQLERNYLTKREEHRALEMQNYMGLARNTGEFDPDREVEGQIFRIGMHLEDIKEQIDRNICHLFYPPPSSSTPSPPPCKDIPLSSSHPSMHEESLLSISTMRQNMDKSEDEEAFEVPYEDHRAESSFILQSSSFSTAKPGAANEEDGLTATGEDLVYEDILTRPSTSAALKQKLTHDRLSENNKSDFRHKEKIRPDESCFPSPETDSGFGSFDLSRPTTGFSQTSPNALSSALSDDVISVASMSGSDSEASHSNVRTTISVATRPVQPTVNHLEYEQLDTTATDNYITHNAPVNLSKVEEASVGGVISMHEQLGKIHTAHDTPDRNTHSPSHCLCHNSEVILALQYEVSHLKRALEESLSHLPHMSRRNDYPNSRSHSERKHRAQTRGQNRAGSNRRVKKDSSLQRTEDWISSDMDPSKSKVTDGEGSDHQRFRVASDRRSHDSRSSSKASVESLFLDTSQFSPSGSHQRASIGPAIHSNSADPRPTHKSATYRPAKGNLGNILVNSNKLASSLPAHLSHKPLLQVNYGSSCSLPAGFKVCDQESKPPVSSRRRSTQSDTALLPSNVFFQRTSPRTSGRRRYTSREESIHKTLDKALQAAFLMKQTTDKMANALSADLAKAQLQRKLHSPLPLSSRTGNCNLLSLGICSSEAH